MDLSAFFAVGTGAVLGAWLRWWLGVRLNPVLPEMPLGTLTANLVGGYVVGLAIAGIAATTGLSLQARLFLITGFCGGLTTFSTFSAETVTLLARGQVGWGLALIGAHVAGSLVATALGLLTVQMLRGAY
jgi:CrcB protein